ncbi:T9SS type A sorting domain-containing protein [bacterium]|nr:T9SS type A sorting domain-containing protein [bacterium]
MLQKTYTARQFVILFTCLLLVLPLGCARSDEDHPGGDLVPAFSEDWSAPTMVRQLGGGSFEALGALRLDNGNSMVLCGKDRDRFESARFYFNIFSENGEHLFENHSQVHDYEINEIDGFIENDGTLWVVDEGGSGGIRRIVKFNQDGDQPVGEGFHSIQLESRIYNSFNWFLDNHPNGGIVYLAVNRNEERHFIVKYRRYGTGFSEVMDSVSIEFEDEILRGHDGTMDISATSDGEIIHAMLYVPYFTDQGLWRSRTFYTQIDYDGELLLAPELVTMDQDSLFDDRFYYKNKPVVDNQGNVYFIHKRIYNLDTATYLTIRKADGSVEGCYLSNEGGDHTLAVDAFNNVHMAFQLDDTQMFYSRITNGDIQNMLPLQLIETEVHGVFGFRDPSMLAHPTKPQIDLYFISAYRNENNILIRGIYRSQLLPLNDNAFETTPIDSSGHFSELEVNDFYMQGFSSNHKRFRVFNIMGQLISGYGADGNSLIQLQSDLSNGTYIIVPVNITENSKPKVISIVK